jgi:hypothetical protein
VHGFVNAYAFDVLTRRPYLTMTRRSVPGVPARCIRGTVFVRRRYRWLRGVEHSLLHEAARFYHIQLHRHSEEFAYLYQRAVRSSATIELMRIG